jgi:hypothetical protein
MCEGYAMSDAPWLTEFPHWGVAPRVVRVLQKARSCHLPSQEVQAINDLRKFFEVAVQSFHPEATTTAADLKEGGGGGGSCTYSSTDTDVDASTVLHGLSLHNLVQAGRVLTKAVLRAKKTLRGACFLTDDELEVVQGATDVYASAIEAVAETLSRRGSACTIQEVDGALHVRIKATLPAFLQAAACTMAVVDE